MVTPDLPGTYVVRVSASVGEAEAEATVSVLAEAPQAAVPSVESVDDQRVTPGGSLEVPIVVVAHDPDAVTVDATSSDQAVLPDSAMSVQGSGSERTLVLTPTAESLARPIVTLVARDAAGEGSSTSFALLVAQPFGEVARLPDARPWP